MKELIKMHAIGIFPAERGVEVVNTRNPILDTQEILRSKLHRVGKESVLAEQRNMNGF